MKQKHKKKHPNILNVGILALGIVTLILVVSESIRDHAVFFNNYTEFNSAPCDAHETKTMTWEDWPAVAYEETGHPLVYKGDSFFNHARELYFQKDINSTSTLMDEFIQIYKNRPDPTNLCGIRINHALALFLTVKQIQPNLVIESGVNAGVSTYFIRAASPTTRIFAIDPLSTPICGQKERWIDQSGRTKYFTGRYFVDLLEMDLKTMILRKTVYPEKTLVFLDDHLHAFQRIYGLMRLGIQHVVVEDNYKIGEGATKLDKKSTPKQMFFGEKYKIEGEWLFRNVEIYAEFPPIVPPIMSEAYKGERKEAGGFMVASDFTWDIMHPILRPDINEDDMKIYEDMAFKLGINSTLEDIESYMQFMNYNQICYLRLPTFPTSLLS